MSSENPTIVGIAPSNGVNGTNGHASSSAAEKLTRNAPTTTTSFKHEPSNLGSFGVKSGLAQMLKGGVIMVSPLPRADL
jgi:hypothetical protein